MKPTYIKVQTVATRCKGCAAQLTLLQHRLASPNKAQFYICWMCIKIYEIGKGEVKNASISPNA